MKNLFKIEELVSSYKNWRRGYGWFPDSDTYSLDFTISKFIIPRLKRFKELNQYSTSLINQDEIDEFNIPKEHYELSGLEGCYALTMEGYGIIIDQIIRPFEIVGKMTLPNKDEIEKMERGLNLFARFFPSLWW